MATNSYNLPPVTPIDLSNIDPDELALNSDMYRALRNFHGNEALHVLGYPQTTQFTENWYTVLVKCLGTKGKFPEEITNCPISELFHIAIYLSSDKLLHHVIYDLLDATTAGPMRTRACGPKD